MMVDISWDNKYPPKYSPAVRATVVGRDVERNVVLAGDLKGLDYYVILI